MCGAPGPPGKLGRCLILQTRPVPGSPSSLVDERRAGRKDVEGWDGREGGWRDGMEDGWRDGRAGNSCRFARRGSPLLSLTSLALVETQSLQTWFAKPKKRSGMLGNGYVCPPEMHKTSVGNLYPGSQMLDLKEYKLMSF